MTTTMLRNSACVLLIAVTVFGCSSGTHRPRRNTIAYVFGEARQEMVIKHTFQVTNPGPQLLKITKVQTTCGCTSTVVKSGATIEAGKTLDVPVELNLRGKKDKVESKVNLYFGPDSVPTELLLQGSVVKEFEDTIAFNKIKRGEQPEQTVELKTYKGQPVLAISEIEFDKTKWDVTSAQGVEPGAFTLHVRPVANAPYGALDDDIVVHTNDTEVPLKSIHVHAHVLKPLEATKTRLALALGKDGKPAEAVAEFSTPYGGVVESPSVTVTRPKRFVATIDPESPAGTLRVHVQGNPPPAGARQSIQATMTVTAKVNGEEVSDKMDLYMVLDGAKAPKEGAEATSPGEQGDGKPNGKVHNGGVSNPAVAR